ncbi:MAG: hypothetical protein ACK554_16960 [Erythrobacteraceae bacterium]
MCIRDIRDPRPHPRRARLTQHPADRDHPLGPAGRNEDLRRGLTEHREDIIKA